MVIVYLKFATHDKTAWRQSFVKVFILNVNRVNVMRQTELYTSEPLIHGPSDFEIETANNKFLRYKSSRTSTDQIPAQMTQSEESRLRSHIRKLINSTWSKQELPQR
jgi:hypothetical protein